MLIFGAAQYHHGALHLFSSLAKSSPVTGEQPPSNNGPLLGNTFYPTFTACYRTDLEQFYYWKKADYIPKLYVIMQNYKRN